MLPTAVASTLGTWTQCVVRARPHSGLRVWCLVQKGGAVGFIAAVHFCHAVNQLVVALGEVGVVSAELVGHVKNNEHTIVIVGDEVVIVVIGLIPFCIVEEVVGQMGRYGFGFIVPFDDFDAGVIGKRRGVRVDDQFFVLNTATEVFNVLDLRFGEVFSVDGAGLEVGQRRI